MSSMDVSDPPLTEEAAAAPSVQEAAAGGGAAGATDRSSTSTPAAKARKQPHASPSPRAPAASASMDSVLGNLSPEMRKLVRRSGMSPGRAPRASIQPLRSELANELTAQRALRRKVLEFWSKGAHGYSRHVLTFCRSLNLTGCSLVDDDGEALSSELTRDMRNLKTVSLSNNKFGDRTLLALSMALARGAAPMITALALDHNAISDAGLKSFSAALVGFEGFDRLRAQSFRERDVVRRALPRLDRLDLSHNAIGPKGAEYLTGVRARERA